MSTVNEGPIHSSSYGNRGTDSPGANLRISNRTYVPHTTVTTKARKSLGKRCSLERCALLLEWRSVLGLGFRVSGLEFRRV